MVSNIKQIRASLERQKGARDRIELDLKRDQDALGSLLLGVEDSLKAQTVINTVAQNTQAELEYHLGDIVSLALSGVFPDPPSLDVSFVPRRGKVEVDMNFREGDYLNDPLESSGGGMVDMASLALRASCWTLKSPRTRPVLLMDEPMKWLKGGDLPEKGAAMIREISARLGLQVIMVSHDPELISGADKIIKISRRNKVSYVE